MPDNSYEDKNTAAEIESLIDDHVSSNSENKVSGVREIKKDPVRVIGEEGAEERDKLYTKLLERFSDNYHTTKKQTKTHKGWFLGIILTLLILLLAGGVTLLFFCLFYDTRSSIAVVIGASVEIFGSFIAIPTIIAKHLFPEKIDNDVIEIVKLLVENDKDIRNTKERHNNH